MLVTQFCLHAKYNRITHTLLPLLSYLEQKRKGKQNVTVFKKNSEKGRNVKLQAFPATQSSLPVTSGWGPSFPNSFPGVLWPRRLALNESSPS